MTPILIFQRYFVFGNYASSCNHILALFLFGKEIMRASNLLGYLKSFAQIQTTAGRTSPTGQSPSHLGQQRNPSELPAIHVIGRRRPPALPKLLGSKQPPRTILSAITAPSSSRPIYDGSYRQFVTHEDIIHPSELGKLERNKDYVLLVHSPKGDTLTAMKLHGLRSLKDLASDENASQDVKDRFKSHDRSSHFGNDPNLIYFRPVSKRYPIREGDVAIAVKLESAKVYDQEHRARSDGNAGTYRASEIPISEYLEMESKQPAGTYLDRYKRIVPFSQYKADSNYLPEVCVKVDRISPEFFVRQDSAL